MAVTITNLFTIQYAATLMALSQQKGSRFASHVRNEPVSGAEYAYFDNIAALDSPTEKTTRHGDTPLVEAAFGRRRVTPAVWEQGILLDDADVKRMLADPQGSIVQAQANSFGRKKDDLIIAAALGAALIGKAGATSVAALNNEDGQIGINGDGTVTASETLPAAQVEVVMTLAKILLMSQLFNQADVDPDIPKFWAVSPGCIKEMLDITEVTSADFVTMKNLTSGKVDSFCGFNFFWTNHLTKDAAGETCWRTIAWAQDGIVLASIGDLATTIGPRADKCNDTQIYSKMDLGAVRMEGAKVHECLNLAS